MKKIILIIVLISSGYFIYNALFSTYYVKAPRTEKMSEVKKLFDKVRSTPVSAQEVKSVFIGSAIDTCQKLGLDPNDSSDLNNGLGTIDECMKNFETLASEQCFEQLPDFENKIYISWNTLKNDYFAFVRCVSDTVSRAAFLNKEKLIRKNKIVPISSNEITIKSLLDKLFTTTVTAQDVKIAFRKVAIQTCEVNGVDTHNGFGTTAECLNNFERFARKQCFEKLTGFDNKTYTSRLELRDDFITYDRCVMDIIMRH